MSLDDRLRYELEESITALNHVINKLPKLITNTITTQLKSIKYYTQSFKISAWRINKLTNAMYELINRMDEVTRTIIKHDNNQTGDLLTEKQVAKMLSVSKWFVIDRYKRGYFEKVKIGKAVRYTKSSIMDYIERCKVHLDPPRR